MLPVRLSLLNRLNLFKSRTCLTRPSESSWRGQEIILADPVYCYREDDPHWAEDLEEDTKGEVENKYGKLTQIVVDKQSQVGPCLFVLCLPKRV